MLQIRKRVKALSLFRNVISTNKLSEVANLNLKNKSVFPSDGYSFIYLRFISSLSLKKCSCDSSSTCCLTRKK